VLPAAQECTADCLSGLDGLYSHSFDKTEGKLTSFVVGPCTSAATVDSLSQCRLSPVASAFFDPAVERIVSVAYPFAGEQIDKRFNILGKLNE